MKKPLRPENAIRRFHIDGNMCSCEKFGPGHINSTYKVLTDTGHAYVLQRINQYVFNRPREVMENVTAITEFIRQRVDDPRETLHFLRTDEGLRYYFDEQGECWRCYEFSDGLCLEAPESERDFYESAIAFGHFQELLRDFPADTLHETIPMFHHTPNRYRLLAAALEKNAAGRADSIREELTFVMDRQQEAGTICALLESGELPLRVTHNDTKINNVLFDRVTRRAFCVLDLDTVMPGSPLYDYGDSIRFGAATAPEDERDLSRQSVNLDLFRVYTAGFLSACPSLTDREKELLPLGAKIITLELAIRFLTDYLDGDLYFRTDYPEHNLVRARAQLKLVADMESKWAEMQNIVAEEAAK